MPAGLQDLRATRWQAALKDPLALDRALGEYLTEPKARVWFEAGAGAAPDRGACALDRRTRMMYDDHHVFINGESYRAGGRDATLMRRLADRRRLDARELARASEDALALLAYWCEAGWCMSAGRCDSSQDDASTLKRGVCHDGQTDHADAPASAAAS